ncbi:glycosyltransferase [Paenibacillus polymyxa]|uniref:glycosyltransferase n=1 Tax=Paenibacillus polymyxa TaxID=1406 RepID=UPI002ECFB424|nr:glycosyltransferase [Paenibacillus polymyxa]
MINQLLPSISYGDAVSDSALNIMKLIRSMGIKSNIYAQHIHPKMRRYVKEASLCPKNESVIYHLSTGSELAYQIPEFSKQKILFYHNITPSNYFTGYNDTLKKRCQDGRDELNFLADYIDVAIAASEYNRAELESLSYKITLTSPIIVNYEDYQTKSDSNLEKMLNQDDCTKILFVGRIAPNKKQDDVIKSFYYYQKYINPKTKLFLVGSIDGTERYYNELNILIKNLQLEEYVTITGHISFNQILSYYRNADLFLCMSEHEGFCVPILEAMYFQLPIISYKSSAITETLGSGGFLILEKDYKVVAELIQIMLTDKELNSKLRANQLNQLQKYSKENASEQFRKIFLEFIKPDY